MMATEVVTNQYLGGDTSLACSQETAGLIDAKVLAIIKEAHEKARQILSENRHKLDVLANFLLEKETITGDEFMALLRREEQTDTNATTDADAVTEAKVVEEGSAETRA